MFRNYRLFFWVNTGCATMCLAAVAFLLTQGVTNWAGLFSAGFFLLMAYVNALLAP